MIVKRAAEEVLIPIDLTNALAVDDELTGTPTAVEHGSSDLTIGTPEIEDPAITSTTPWPWPTTDMARKLSFLVSGGTAGNDYTIRVTVATDSGQTLIRDVRLRCT